MTGKTQEVKLVDLVRSELGYLLHNRETHNETTDDIIMTFDLKTEDSSEIEYDEYNYDTNTLEEFLKELKSDLETDLVGKEVKLVTIGFYDGDSDEIGNTLYFEKDSSGNFSSIKEPKK